MRRRSLPVLLALAGLAIPTIHDGLTTWPITVGWLVVLAGFAWIAPAALPSRASRMAAAAILLPVLFVLAWEGGWWLIPADLAWLVIEWRTVGRPAPEARPN